MIGYRIILLFLFLLSSFYKMRNCKYWRKNSVTLFKDGKADFIKTIMIDIGTTVMEFDSQWETLDSTPKTAWASGNIWPTNRLEVSGWENIKGKEGSG